MNSKLWRLLLVIVLIVAACSGDETDDMTANPEDSAAQAEQVDVGPDIDPETEPVPSSTVVPEVETIEPEVLESNKLSRVYIAANGNDGSNGANPNSAVRSIDRAFSLIQPGGSIIFQPGTYPPLRVIGKQGSPGAPIRLEASGSVEFRDKDYKSGAGILVENSQHLEIVGMRTRRSLWAIYVVNTHNLTIRGNDFGDIGQEGIRIKGGSSNVRIEANTVSDTGRRTDKGPSNGEGIYLGTGSPGGVDHVRNVVVVNNRIVRTTDEAIDVKRPSSNIDIIGNTISDVKTQTTGAIVVHLNGDQGGNPDINIERNVVRNVTRVSPYNDGNCIVSQVTVRIVNNVLHNCQHRGIFLKGSGGTATIQHNTLINTGSIGAIVNEGRGMGVVSENNLGASGDRNRTAGSDVFVNASGGNYQLTSSAAGQLKSAPNLGVSNDLSGSRRPGSGPVTFGAVEAAGAPAAPPTTQAPPPTAAPTTTAAPRSAPATTQAPRVTVPRNAAPAPTTPPNRSSAPTPARPDATITELLTPPPSSSQSSSSPQSSSNPASPEAVESSSAADSSVALGPTPDSGLDAVAALPESEGTSSGLGPGFPALGPPPIGRTLGEPREFGPLLPGDDDGAAPLDRASCFNSVICIWAPFL